LKEEIERLKEKNVKVVSDLHSSRHDYVNLKRDYEEKMKAYEKMVRKQRVERDYTFIIKHDLATTHTELTMHIQE